MRVVLAIALPVAALVVVGIALPYVLISRVDESNRLPNAARWIIAGAVFAVVVALIGAISNQDTGVALETRRATASASASASTASAPETAQLTPTIRVGELADPSGDLLRADGVGARGPRYMDILLVAAMIDADVTTLRLDLGETPPTVDPVENEISYGFFLDVNADNAADYRVLISNIEGGGEFVGHVELASGEGSGEAVLLDSISVQDGLVVAQVPYGAIGSPQSLSIAVFSEWTLYDSSSDGGRDQVTDNAPDLMWPNNGAEWVVIQ